MNYRSVIKKGIAMNGIEPEEHTENIGGPNVAIEPAYQGALQKAVDYVRQNYPDLLNDVSDIVGHIDSGERLFGRFETGMPHTIAVNIQDIENEVRTQLANATEEQIRKTILEEIVKTIVHEATHKVEHDTAGTSNEDGPERAEQDAQKRMDMMPISQRDKAPLVRRAFDVTKILEKLLKRPKGEEGDYDSDELEKGTRVELEHTNNEEMAKTIAMHHLDEDPEYYRKLEVVEASRLGNFR